MRTQTRNELTTALDHARQFRQAAGDTEHLADVAEDIEMLMDIWSRRSPLAVTPGERHEMHNMFRQAEHLGAASKELAETEHYFNLALG